VNGPLLLRPPWGSGVGGFCSTRVGGASKGPYRSLNLGLNTQDDPPSVRANRAAAFAAAGADLARSVHACQVHGDRVLGVGEAEAGRGSLAWEQGLPDCDALWTRAKGLPLSIGHADCLALLLVDVQAGLLGLANAGWRGALAQVPAKLAKALLDQGAQAERLQALLSPCLGPDHLELAEEQWRLFQAADPAWKGYCSRLEGGHFKLDLWSCARRQLEALGLSARQIHGQELDTWDHPELFFSHRRDQGRTGRMLSVAWLE
jgi:polyphenol oxidase